MIRKFIRRLILHLFYSRPSCNIGETIDPKTCRKYIYTYNI